MRMSNGTKTIFDAPWELDEEEQVRNASGDLVAEGGVSVDDLRRVTHLPELFDALMEAAYENCRVCIYGHSKNARQMPKPDDMARNGCTLSDFPYCPNRNWWNLLKKVRDGK